MVIHINNKNKYTNNNQNLNHQETSTQKIRVKGVYVITIGKGRLRWMCFRVNYSCITQTSSGLSASLALAHVMQ